MKAGGQRLRGNAWKNLISSPGSSQTMVMSFNPKDQDPGPRHVQPSRKVASRSQLDVKVSRWQCYTLFRRLLILIAALYYIAVSIQCCATSLRVLVGARQHPDLGLPYISALTVSALGNATVHESFLVQTLLNADTSPRQTTLYLFTTETNILQISTKGCPSPTAVDSVYTDTFLRKMFAALVHGTSYNLTFLAPTISELMAPLVDCTSGGRVLEDFTAGHFFFLLRNKSDVSATSLLVVNLSNQGYQAVTRNDMGSASVMTVALLTDMNATSIEHHFVMSLGYPFEQFDLVVYEYLATTEDNNWKLRSLPRNPRAESRRTLLTAARSGFFVGTENEQSLIVNSVWVLGSNPHQVAGSLAWFDKPVLHDSWAWVHLVHGFLAWGVLFQVMVLLVITIRNLRTKKFWIGDAFVGVSSSLEVRGFIAIASMAMNKFWAIKEVCLGDALVVSLGNKSEQRAIVRADLLSIYLCLVGLLAKPLKVRIDPALTVGMFELGFQYRASIRAWSPQITAIFAEIGSEDFDAGIVRSDDDTSLISPMLLWGPHKMIPLPFSIFLGMLFPVFITMLPLTMLTFAREGVRTWCRRKLNNRPTGKQVASTTAYCEASDATENETFTSVPQRTNFELATGAHLADQYGLVGEYDTYKYIKGLRFASADGIYNNGFVIVNHKFLVQTSDLLTIAMMRLIRLRFGNVYAYDVDNHSVGARARLVYPDTITFSDLLCIDINVLT